MLPRPSALACQPTNVIVKIGPEKKKYYLHRSLLIAHSEYFAKALSGSWKEAQEGIVTLEDVECKPFDIFVDWMYSGHIPVFDCDWNRDRGNNQLGPAQVARLNTYVLADRIRVSEFAKEVQDELVRNAMITEFASYESIIFGFANLPSNDTILDLMVDLQCRAKVEPDSPLSELDKQLPVEFLFRVMGRYSKMRVDGFDWMDDLDPCDYHSHALEEELDCTRGR